jgi:hypothetical protein
VLSKARQSFEVGFRLVGLMIVGNARCGSLQGEIGRRWFEAQN